MKEQLALYGKRLLPRILTQICRDGNIPLSGACDRNYWHYKIRDFSSSILQQAGYTVWTSIGVVDYPPKALERIGAESCRFWNRRARMFRAFEEYYPWESGYPPVAFSSLAVAKMTAAGLVDKSEMRAGFQVAARQLIERFEPKATNQQVAGMAALCWIRKIYPDLVTEEKLKRVVTNSLACQHKEGWYMEYGGPDLGYLSVTMDCLWDAYDATGDKRFVDSAERALRFIGRFVSLSPRGIGMHNARNTDYIVPYGIARFLEVDGAADIASALLRNLFSGIESPGHFLNAVDDRYWCHYIGASFYRAIPLLDNLRAETKMQSEAGSEFVEGTGHLLRYDAAPFKAIVSAKKGGVLTLFDGNGKTMSDYGWIVKSGDAIWTNHWWDESWMCERDGDQIVVLGHLSRHKYLKNTPFRHMVLRVLSFCVGNKIIALLKQKMIFKTGGCNGPVFKRTIRFEQDKDRVVVSDCFGLPAGCTVGDVVRAPRSSQRHVASADSFHYEDFDLAERGVMIMRAEKIDHQAGAVTIETVYSSK